MLACPLAILFCEGIWGVLSVSLTTTLPPSPTHAWVSLAEWRAKYQKHQPKHGKRGVLIDSMCLLGRPRTSTLEEFFGEDAGFFDLQSQIQLARRRSMRGDLLGDRAAQLRAHDGQGSESPHTGPSQQGRLLPLLSVDLASIPRQ